MIMGRKAPGRSYYVADIPFKVDRELALVSEFCLRMALRREIP
jgi:hypothetical protein